MDTGTHAMPRKKTGKPKVDYVTVKIEAGIHRQAKHIVTDSGDDIGGYLSDLLRGPVAREYQRLLKKMRGEEEPGSA
jgi:hypothetical protein